MQPAAGSAAETHVDVTPSTEERTTSSLLGAESEGSSDEFEEVEPSVEGASRRRWCFKLLPLLVVLLIAAAALMEAPTKLLSFVRPHTDALSFDAALSGVSTVSGERVRLSMDQALPRDLTDAPSQTASATTRSLEQVAAALDASRAPGFHHFLNCVTAQRATRSAAGGSAATAQVRVAVVTSIAPAAMLAMLSLVQWREAWCLVVIGDATSPTHKQYIDNLHVQTTQADPPTYQEYARQQKESILATAAAAGATAASTTDATAAATTDAAAGVSAPLLLSEDDYAKLRAHILAQREQHLRYTVTTDISGKALQSALNARLSYFDLSEQQLLPYAVARHSPVRHFSRKNVGFVLAIHAGADVIFDFDDDNLVALHALAPDASEPPFFGPHPINMKQPADEQIELVRDASVSGKSASGDDARAALYSLWNPYPFASLSTGWPRGYPLPSVARSVQLLSPTAVHSAPLHCLPVVQQYLANVDPDVDAIWRMTSPQFENHWPIHLAPKDEAERAQMQLAGSWFMPFSQVQATKEQHTIALPPHAFTPYNAQATMHLRGGFFAMMLPRSVHGRVSDIWRSYFTQTLLTYTSFGATATGQRHATAVAAVAAPTSSSTPACVAFLPPCIAHFRNPHAYHRDFMSELPLYTHAPALLEFLQQRRRGGSMDLSTRVGLNTPSAAAGEAPLLRWLLRLQVQLYDDLYAAKVLKEDELAYIRDWANDLAHMTTQR